MDSNVLDLLLDIKDSIANIQADTAVIKSDVGHYMKTTDELASKVNKLERQVNLAHGALLLITLIAGVVKAFSH
jgi:hypothetical protein